VEDGFRWLATWVATNYSGMGKTVDDALPGACVCVCECVCVCVCVCVSDRACTLVWLHELLIVLMCMQAGPYGSGLLRLGVTLVVDAWFLTLTLWM